MTDCALRHRAARWKLAGVALLLLAGAQAVRAAEVAEAVETALNRAIEQYLKADFDGCNTVLRQVEGKAWAERPALRNRWHRQVWQCEVRQDLSNPPNWQRWSAWMGEWLRRFENEADVDLRFQESTRVIHWVYRATSGDTIDLDIAAVLEPLVQRVAESPRLDAWPPPPAMARLLLILGEMGGQLALEQPLQSWRTRLAQRFGDDHVLVLLADKSLAFTARKAGRTGESLALARSAWERFDGRGMQLPNVRQALSSELAAALADSGRLGEALRHARLTQSILAGMPGESGLRPGRAAYNTAAMALALGDFEAARDEAQASMRHFLASATYAAGEAEYAQQVLQQARLELGEPGAAEALERALAASTATSDWVGVAALRLLAWSEARGDRERSARARQFFEEHIRSTKTVFHPARTAQELLNSTDAAARGDHQLASLAIARAWLQAYAGHSAEDQAAAWMAWAAAEHRFGRHEWAIWSGKRAAAALLPALDHLNGEQRAGWLDVRRALLQQLQMVVLWLADAGRLPEAESLAAELQAGEVRHYLARGGLRSAAAVRTAWSSQEIAWSASLDALQLQIDEALVAERAQGTELQPWQESASAERLIVQRREALRDRLALMLLAWRESFETSSSHSKPEATAAVAPRAAPATKAQAAAAPNTPPAGTALLWWAVSEDRLMVAARMRDAQVVRTLPVGRSALMRQVLLAREEVRDSARLRHQALEQLQAWLIEPIEAELRARRIQHLRLRLSAELHAVPFGALWRAGASTPYLIERFTLSVQTQDATPRAEPSQASLWALGSTRGETESDALPWVRQELAQIARRARLPHREALDEHFNWRRLQEALSAPVGAIHLATHFRMHPSLPQQSYLLLGDGQRAGLEQLAGLPWRRAGLTVASACDTGLGAPGVAVASLRQTLQLAGAGPVIASLWSVQDESTAHFMPWVYMQWRQQGWSTRAAGAKALGLAQRAWLRQYRGHPWAHPRHWAGFTWFE